MVDVCHHTPVGNEANVRTLTACLCLVLMVVTPACLRLWGEDNMECKAGHVFQWPDPGERESTTYLAFCCLLPQTLRILQNIDMQLHKSMYPAPSLPTLLPSLPTLLPSLTSSELTFFQLPAAFSRHQGRGERTWW